MDMSKKEERKKRSDRSPMSRSQVYRNDMDKSMMSHSVASVRVNSSTSRVEKRRSPPEPITRSNNELKELEKQVKPEPSPRSSSDPIETLVTQLLTKSPEERQPLELKFIQENNDKETVIKYIVSEVWITKYGDYLNGNTKQPPGRINNQEVQQKSMSKSAQNAQIYLVNEMIWKFISKLYGGGPAVPQQNRSISVTPSESDKFSEPQTADTMSRSEFNESVKGTVAKSTIKKPNFYLKPVGMANESFYCYMNSCLQGLLSISELAYYASEEKYKEASTNKSLKFWKAINEIVAGYNKRSSCCTPRGVRKIAMNMFDPDEQHDAHEFLRFLLSGMQDEINLARPKKQVEINDPDMSWAYYRKYNISIVDELFAGQLTNKVSCGACNYVSTTFDPFLDLSLPIKPGKTNTIDDCLEIFQNEEEIRDSYVCEKCKSKSKAIKRLVVNRFPRYLVIHLKRFQTYPRKKKIIDHITFPMDNWSIKKVNGKDVQTYSLVANIVHKGSFDSGHYVCYCKRGGEWVICDDESIRSVSAKEVAGREAYVLIYERKN